MERGYDPLELARRVEEKVCGEHGRRRYYRFRATRFYGGIATGDVVGCNLRCIFCWTGRPRDDLTCGWMVSPEEAYRRLVGIAYAHGFQLLRLSAGEPTLCRDHLLELLELVHQRTRLHFILETNGVLLGADEGYVRRLAAYPRLHVRVSVKACSPDLFHKLTGAKPSAWRLQLEAIRHLAKHGVSYHVAIVASFGTRECWSRFFEELAAIDEEALDNLEVEVLTLYPHVEARLRRAGVWPHTYYTRDGRLVRLEVTPDGLGALREPR